MNTKLRQHIVDYACSFLGTKRGDTKHKYIIDGYNTIKPLPRNYKVTYKDAWCATFVSFVGMMNMITDIIPFECGCGEMIKLFQKLGRWHENENYIPSIGDIIFYDWDDKTNFAVTNNTGSPEHVGIVCKVQGKNFEVIEGNMGSYSVVGIRKMQVNGRYIRGFGLPDYESIKMEEEETNMTPEQIKKIVQDEIDAYFNRQSERPEGKWDKELWDRAVSAGLVDGTKPLGFITRKECVVITMRALDKLEVINNGT